MNSAFSLAFARAAKGLDWGKPCLIWLADWIAAETGDDPAAAWRSGIWDESRAKRELAKLALEGEGATAVERALDAMARRKLWPERETITEGAALIGVFDAVSLDGQPESAPAIWDGMKMWLIGNVGRAATLTPQTPKRIWRVG